MKEPEPSKALADVEQGDERSEVRCARLEAAINNLRADLDRLKILVTGYV